MTPPGDDVQGEEVARRALPGGALVVVRGDLSAQRVDAVVNAANEHLRHGGGVAAALARAGGPVVQEESDRWVDEHGTLGPGDAAVTTAGALPARVIVHVVGPRYRDGQDNEALLAQAVHAALVAARDGGADALALPAISAGIFGYPPAEAARVIAATCQRWLESEQAGLEEIRLVAFDADTAGHFSAAIGEA